MKVRARKFMLAVGAAVMAMALVAQPALAEPQDYDEIKTGALAEITAALTAVWPILALIIGALVGVKLFKRFV